MRCRGRRGLGNGDRVRGDQLQVPAVPDLSKDGKTVSVIDLNRLVPKFDLDGEEEPGPSTGTRSANDKRYEEEPLNDETGKQIGK